MTQAKKLKHEADRDSANRERQAMKYLEAVLYFALCGSTTESRGEHATAYTMYKETLSLVRHASRHPRYVNFKNYNNGPQNLQMSQARSTGSSTRCTRTNTFPELKVVDLRVLYKLET